LKFAIKMTQQTLRTVLFLTLSILPVGCSLIPEISFRDSDIRDACKIHAYIYEPLWDVLSDQNDTVTPPRVGIIPFTVPANLTSTTTSTTGLGHELAWEIHQTLLQKQGQAIFEILNREDWPGKREEFYNGNFGGISQAYAAGYTYIIVGHLQPLTSLSKASLLIKVINVASHKSVSYIEVKRSIPHFHPSTRPPSFLDDGYEPSSYYPKKLFQPLARCAATYLWEGQEENSNDLFSYLTHFFL